MRRFLVCVLLVGLVVSWASSQNVVKPAKPSIPKFEAVAETRLLMEGINQANFRGLETILRGVPKDAEAWTFARGQALLIAESGNLLMLRPPKTQGLEAWYSRAIELRETASKLARLAATQDLVKARTALVDVANVCNKCHETFRVNTRIRVFANEKD
jgi:hypothetical protein